LLITDGDGDKAVVVAAGNINPELVFISLIRRFSASAAAIFCLTFILNACLRSVFSSTMKQKRLLMKKTK
jgi:hypothetical protein